MGELRTNLLRAAKKTQWIGKIEWRSFHVFVNLDEGETENANNWLCCV